MYHIFDDHAKRLPFVRISKIELTHFKDVRHGVIEFNCSKEPIPYNTKSDILGLYGQNGSGKSSLVEAINTIKSIIGGYRLGPNFARYIDVAADYSIIFIEFDFQYKSGLNATVSYEVKLERKDKSEVYFDGEGSVKQQFPYISYEVIKTNMYADGSIGRIHSIIDTRDRLLCSDTLENYYYDTENAKIKEELFYIKRKSHDDSQSFVYCNALSETLNIRNTEQNHSKYYEILAELDLFANGFLGVIGTRTSGLVQLRAGIPLYLPKYYRPVLITDKTVLTKDIYKDVEEWMIRINEALQTIIPDLKLRLDSVPTKTNNGEDGMFVQIMSIRGDRIFPFEYESDGIIKIVSILAWFIFSYNQGSSTMVVDELDSGVFEYLLGELLQIFEQSGKGQLIFTSHNLRPLEVLDKKFIRFTTADADSRYYKLKNISSKNNLRDLYLREVQLGNQNVEMYRRTKSFKIAHAIKKAGDLFE